MGFLVLASIFLQISQHSSGGVVDIMSPAFTSQDLVLIPNLGWVNLGRPWSSFQITLHANRTCDLVGTPASFTMAHIETVIVLL